MKRFISKTLGFLAIGFGLIILLFFSARWGISKVSLKIQEDKHILVIGDSYTEDAINDDIFTSSINLSSSGRGIPFCYFLLKDKIEQNPQIDTVLLSFCPGRVNKGYDNFILYNDAYFRVHLPCTILRATYDDMLPMLKVPNFYFYSLRSTFSVANLNLFVNAFLGRLSDDVRTRSVGHFVGVTRNALAKNIDIVEKNPPKNDISIDSDSISFQYLIMMQRYLNEKGIKLILINTPKYKIDRYGNRKDWDILREKMLPEFTYLDFSDFPLDDTHYADLGHLNYKGAAAFSTYLQEHGLYEYKSTKKYEDK